MSTTPQSGWHEAVFALGLSAVLAAVALFVLLGDVLGPGVVWHWAEGANLWLQLVPDTATLLVDVYLHPDLSSLGDSSILAATLLLAAIVFGEARQRRTLRRT